MGTFKKLVTGKLLTKISMKKKPENSNSKYMNVCIKKKKCSPCHPAPRIIIFVHGLFGFFFFYVSRMHF